MKTPIWILPIAALNAVALWIVAGPAAFEGTLAATLAGLFFLGAGLGGLWMIFVAIRHESKPLPYVFVAFMPFVFLWYYFECYRGKSSHHVWKANGTRGGDDKS